MARCSAKAQGQLYLYLTQSNKVPWYITDFNPHTSKYRTFVFIGTLIRPNSEMTQSNRQKIVLYRP